MKNMRKGILVGALSMSMLVSAPLSASAASQAGVSDAPYAVTAKYEKPEKQNQKKNEAQGKEIGKVTCTSAGKVNISFRGQVTYTDAVTAAIKDEAGEEIPCKIVKKNKGMMSVSASGLVKGQLYTIMIEGILGQNSGEAVTIEKTFTAKGMKTKCKVDSAAVQGKNFVVLKMKSAVSYKDATVLVTDSNGQECEAKIVKKARGNIKIQISGMKKGSTYTIVVNGVKIKKEKSYSSITKTITVK